MFRYNHNRDLARLCLYNIISCHGTDAYPTRPKNVDTHAKKKEGPAKIMEESCKSSPLEIERYCLPDMLLQTPNTLPDNKYTSVHQRNKK